jgi:hypothetical protein
MKQVVGIFVGIAMLASAATAMAKHNGNICQPITGDVSKVSYFRFGVENGADTAAQVWCPIDRAYVNDEAGSFVRVWVYDRNSSSDFSCTGWVMDSDGDVIDQQTVSSVGSGIASQALDFNTLDLPNSNTTFQCTIPPKQAGSLSHLASFQFVFS